MNKIFLVAEVGGNHNGDFGLAKKLVEQLAGSGADAVKFQIGNPEALLSKQAFRPAYQRSNDNAADLFEAARSRQLSREDHKRLQHLCFELGLEYMCTAFDLENLQFINEELGIQRFKVSSSDLLTPDLAEYIKASHKPTILSTGMATPHEIRDGIALHALPGSEKRLTLLHCVSLYPTPPSSLNLRWMVEMGQLFGLRVGFSDHSLGLAAPLAAAALGAKVIEKHVTLDKSLRGPDHQSSATVEEFKSMAALVRQVEEALGSRTKSISNAEREVARAARKSVATRRFLPQGHTIASEDLTFLRPGTGIQPKDLPSVVGRRTCREIGPNTLIRPTDFL